MSALLSVTGLLILAIAFTDLFITVLTARGAGPVTGRMTAWIWQGLLALHSRKRTHLFLGIAGPLIAVLTVIGWIVLFWAGWCQRRVNFPQKCRSKIPHFCGFGDQPGSVIGHSISVFRRTPTTLRGRGWSDRSVGPNMLGDEVGVAA
jgi:hypothetical protein